MKIAQVTITNCQTEEEKTFYVTNQIFKKDKDGKEKLEINMDKL